MLTAYCLILRDSKRLHIRSLAFFTSFDHATSHVRNMLEAATAEEAQELHGPCYYQHATIGKKIGVIAFEMIIPADGRVAKLLQKSIAADSSSPAYCFVDFENPQDRTAAEEKDWNEARALQSTGRKSIVTYRQTLVLDHSMRPFLSPRRQSILEYRPGESL